jgi:hypothetical protein
VANGIITIQGNQTGLSNGSISIGPYTIPCSPIGTLLAAPSNATTSFTVPTDLSGSNVVPQGVVVVSNATAAMTCSAGFITSELTRISPLGYPSIWSFDAASVPTTIFVTVSNTVGALVFVQFF